jgi:hypothetical protein
MRVVLTRHAQLQVAMRKLDPALVEKVASQPEQITPAYEGLRWAQSRYNQQGRGYLLRVLFREQGDVRIVVTIYPTSQVAKYWEGER